MMNVPQIPQMMNGRVVNITDIDARDYNTFATQSSSYNIGGVKHILTDSKLSCLFFSGQNINNIQATIRRKVYDATNELIAEQSTTELQILMRAVYLQYGKFLPTNQVEQINELNTIIIKKIVPSILSEMLQYRGYLHDIQYLPLPIERSINVSNKGSRNLKSVTDTF